MQPKSKPSFDIKAQWMPNLYKFRDFYEQTGFNLQQCLAITNAIVELTDPSGGLRPRPKKDVRRK